MQTTESPMELELETRDGVCLNNTSVITSKTRVALQFFWQGYEAYAKQWRGENLVPCFFNSQGDLAGHGNLAAEYVHIMPLEENRHRTIVNGAKVQIVSTRTGEFLRGTRVSKYLKWSKSRDSQTMFWVHSFDGKPLSVTSKFTLESCYWQGHQVGFTQSFPLGGCRELTKAIGFLTLEKKKSQAPLLFPIRFRAMPQDWREANANASNMLDEGSIAQLSTAVVSPSELVFYDDSQRWDRVSEDFPVANMLSPEADPTRSTSPRNVPAPESCPYCYSCYYSRNALMDHIQDEHRDWLERVPMPGAYCVQCGRRKVDNRCPRCGGV